MTEGTVKAKQSLQGLIEVINFIKLRLEIKYCRQVRKHWSK